ncbi:hypothetical protein CC80DRAFT_552583 [Byssothecium circinans]|uniref:RING-type domain-containing protein n=1 Tax=Byssothecium circinans TaxID=147558 RepID=A0A6A5TKA3_9PLEO|nr:hypothetical protein CC80DRAFT_552583 [Byssothecium circinans]
MPALPHSKESFLSSLRPAPAGETTEDCSICMEDYSSASHIPIKLLCSHIFGKRCIAEWVNSTGPNSNTCALCRAQLFSDGRPTYDERLNDESGAVRAVNDFEAGRPVRGPFAGGDPFVDLADTFGGLGMGRGRYDRDRDGPGYDRGYGRGGEDRYGDFSMAFDFGHGPTVVSGRGPAGGFGPGSFGHGPSMGFSLGSGHGGDLFGFGGAAADTDSETEFDIQATLRGAMDQMSRSLVRGRDREPRIGRSGISFGASVFDLYFPPPSPHRGGHRLVLPSPSPPRRRGGYRANYSPSPSPPRRDLHSYRPNRDMLARAAAAEERKARERERQRAEAAISREHERPKTLADFERRFSSMDLHENEGRRDRGRDRGGRRVQASPPPPRGGGRRRAPSPEPPRGPALGPEEGDILWMTLVSHREAEPFFNTLWATVHNHNRPRYLRSNRTITSRMRLSLLRTLEGAVRHFRDCPGAHVFRRYRTLISAARTSGEQGSDLANDPQMWNIRHMIKLVVTMSKISVVLPVDAVKNATLFADVVNSTGEEPFGWNAFNLAVERLSYQDAPVLQLLALMVRVAPAPELVRELGQEGFRGEPSELLHRRSNRVRRQFLDLRLADAFRWVNAEGDGIVDIYGG